MSETLLITFLGYKLMYDTDWNGSCNAFREIATVSIRNPDRTTYWLGLAILNRVAMNRPTPTAPPMSKPLPSPFLDF